MKKLDKLKSKYFHYYRQIYDFDIDKNIFFKLNYIIKEMENYNKVAVLPSGFHARALVDILKKDLNIKFYDDYRVNQFIQNYKIESLKYIEKDCDKYYILNNNNQLIQNLYNKLINQNIDKDKIILYNKLAIKLVSNAEKLHSIYILFIAFKFPSPFLNIVEDIKKRGFKIAIITTSDNASFGEPLFKYFNKVILVKFDDFFDKLKEIIKNFHGKVISIGNFVADHIFFYEIHKLLKDNHYYYKYDMVDGYYCCMTKTPFKTSTHKQLEVLLGKDIWLLDEACKSKLYTNVNGVIYRDSKKIFYKIRSKYNTNIKGLQILPIPKAKNIKTKVNNQKNTSIVWVGHLSINEESSGPQNSLFEIIPLILDNALINISFHMYNISDNNLILKEKFLTKLKNKKNFFYHQPIIGENNLLPVIANYKYGFMIYNFKEYDYNMNFHKLTISTKFFTYINAELPILISEEYEEMCKIVNKYNCGIILNYKKLYKLYDILKNYDYETLKKNVKLAKMHLEKERRLNVNNLLKFLGVDNEGR